MNKERVIRCSFWTCRKEFYDYPSHMAARRMEGMAYEKREQDRGTDQDDPSHFIYGRIILLSPDNPILLDYLVIILSIQLPDYVV